MLGINLAFGGLGGILSSLPLAAFSDRYGWKLSFIWISVLEFIFSILLLILGYENPEKFGYISI